MGNILLVAPQPLLAHVKGLPGPHNYIVLALNEFGVLFCSAEEAEQHPGQDGSAAGELAFQACRGAAI